MAVMCIRGKEFDRSALEEEKKALALRRRELLEQAGYSEQDLQPRYQCEKCRDTGFIDGRECSCFRTEIISLLYDQSNIREILERENFSTCDLRYYRKDPLPEENGESPFSIAKKAFEYAVDFVKHFESSSDNLFITGATGTGKTFLCNCIAKEILDKG